MSENTSKEDPSSAIQRPTQRWKLSSIIMAAVLFASIWALYAVFIQMPANQRKLVFYDTKMFGLRYHNFYAATGRSPSSLAELEPSKNSNPNRGRSNGDFPELTFQRIRSGEFVVVWDAILSANGGGNDQFVLGYESVAPTKGGLVLKGGGVVQQMSAAEFNAMPLISTRKVPSAE